MRGLDPRISPGLPMKFAWLLFLALAGPAVAQTDGSVSIDWKDAPKGVVGKIDCGGPETGITRRAFAGGFVFAAQCPGNHANFIQALVYADDAQGTNAADDVSASRKEKRDQSGGLTVQHALFSETARTHRALDPAGIGNLPHRRPLAARCTSAAAAH